MNTISPLTIVLACSLVFTACDRKKVQNETPAQPQDTGIDRLQSGDTIAAKIHQSPDFDVEAKIDPSGKVFFRLIGNVSVAGLEVKARDCFTDQEAIGRSSSHSRLYNENSTT